MFNFFNKKAYRYSKDIKIIDSARNKYLANELEVFENIISFAQSVIEKTNQNKNLYIKNYAKGNDHPILDVVRLVGRNVQTKYLTSLLFHEDESSLPSLLSEEIYFNSRTSLTIDDMTFSDLAKEITTNKEIQLGKDLILPWPWKRSRLINTISYLGEGRNWGEWKQDFNNHFTELWLPIGIVWVHGGNHSIATGILQGIGTLKPTHTYDISNIFDYIFTDGLYFYRKEDNTIVCPVKDVDFAALFEIGRLMKENDISF